jgi:hypothetical protein
MPGVLQYVRLFSLTSQLRQLFGLFTLDNLSKAK